MLHTPRIVDLGDGQELAIGFTMCFTEPACQIARLRRNAPPSSGRSIEPMLTLSRAQLDSLIAALVEVRDGMPRPTALRPSVSALVALLRAQPEPDDTSIQASMRPLGREWAAYLRELGMPSSPTLIQIADVMADVYVHVGGWRLLDPDAARRQAPRGAPGVAFMATDDELLLLDTDGRVLGWSAGSTEARPVAPDLDTLLVRLVARVARGEDAISLGSMIQEAEPTSRDRP
jgi:hypothetical protein